MPIGMMQVGGLHGMMNGMLMNGFHPRVAPPMQQVLLLLYWYMYGLLSDMLPARLQCTIYRLHVSTY